SGSSLLVNRPRLILPPISSLLGGRRRDEIRAYATGHFWPDVDSFEEVREAVVAEAENNVAAGFDAVKNKIGGERLMSWSREEDLELVRAVRETVGDDVRVMTDANHAYDVADAKWVGDRLADLDVYFFEEPLSPTDLDGYERLNAMLDVPLAAGECWGFEDEFDEVLERGCVEYVQPDVASAGGFTSTRRIATLAHGKNRKCLPHVFGSALLLAASLQVLATIPGEPMVEFDRTPNPIRDDLPVDPITNDGNTVAIPDEPGLGVELDPDVLDSFRVD
ncbi:MAG: mandelate racemase/muconate lactonizing enzyme family protein, partial [Halobacteriota archaeon]